MDKLFDINKYTKNYGKLIRQWSSLELIPERDDIDEKMLKKIVKYRDDIMKYANENDYSQSTINKWKSCISSAFRHIATTEEEKNEYKKFSKSLSDDIYAFEDKKKQEDPKPVPEWEEIIYRAKTYIDSESKFNDDNYLKILLAQFIIHYVPLRPQIYLTLVIKDKYDPDSDDNYICKYKDTYMICINTDKVSKTLGRSCSILPNRLARCIDENLKFEKRKVLFDDISMNKIGKYVRSIFKCTFNDLRSSFIVNEFSRNQAYHDREITATKMRHSVETAMLHYNKIKPSQKEENDTFIIDKYFKPSEKKYGESDDIKPSNLSENESDL